MTNNHIIASNHQALYISSRVYGVGEVSDEASKKVPVAIARANTTNKTDVNRVEKSISKIFFCISKKLAANLSKSFH